VFLFKRILDFTKREQAELDKRGDKRYPVGAKSLIKVKLALPARDGDGNLLAPGKHDPVDWGGQLVNLSHNGASIRLHPAAVAEAGEKCCVKLELDNKIFEIDAAVAHSRATTQQLSCGIILNFADSYARKAYLQLMEPIVIGSTLEPVMATVTQDTPGLVKQLFKGESETELKVWRDETDRNPRHFELLVHDFRVRGSTEIPGLQIGWRDSATTAPLTNSHKAEVRQFFQFIIQNLAKGLPADVRKFLELLAA